MPESQPPPRTLVYYSDYGCPLSYIGKQLVDQYARWAVFPVDLEYRFLDLNWYLRSPTGVIDNSVDQTPGDHYGKVRESTKVLMEQLDFEMPLKFIGEIDSWNAHQAAFYVNQQYPLPVYEAFHDGVFTALWREGRDVSDPAVLKAIAEDVGVRASEIADALCDDDLEASLRVTFKEVATHRLPISPMVVYQKVASYGITPFADIRRLTQAGEGHPADEMGAQWFRYHDHFSS